MENDVKFKKNRKPMPQSLYLGLFLFVLGAICAFLLAFVNDLTKDSIAENDKKTAEAENSTIIDDLKNIYQGENINAVDLKTVSYRLIDESEVSLKSIFKSDSDKWMAFKFETTNNYATFNVLVVIEYSKVEASYQYNVKSVKVLDTYKPTTFGASVDNNFYSSAWGVEGATEEQVVGSATEDSSFEIVAGATYSSNSVKLAIRAAFAQSKEILEGNRG